MKFCSDFHQDSRVHCMGLLVCVVYLNNSDFLDWQDAWHTLLLTFQTLLQGLPPKMFSKNVFGNKVLNFYTKKVLKWEVFGNEVLPFWDLIFWAFLLLPVWFYTRTSPNVWMFTTMQKKEIDIYNNLGYIYYAVV